MKILQQKIRDEVQGMKYETRGVCDRQDETFTSYFVSPRTCFFVLFVISCHSWHIGDAQFIPYSQYYNSPLLTNPSEAAWTDYTQLTLHYRRSRVANYEIPSVSFVHPFYRNRDGVRFGGAGVSVINQKAGPGGLYNIMGALGTFAYTVHFTKRHHLSAGLQGGIINKKIDLSGISTDNQFNFGVYDASMPHGENIQFDRASSAVINAGFTWAFTDSTNVPKAMLGIAFSNMNRPAYEFMAGSGNREEVAYTITGQVRLLEYGRASVNPTFRYIGGTSSFANVGAQLRYQLMQDDNDISVGLWYKTTQALVTAVQYSSRNYTVAASMDFTSNTALQASINNALEISLCWRLKKRTKTIEVKASSSDDILFASTSGSSAASDKLPGVFSGQELPGPEVREEDPHQPYPAAPISLPVSAAHEISPDEAAILETRISFYLGSYELTPESVQFIQTQLVPLIRNHPDHVLYITGHSCTLGDKAINEEISLHRAAAVGQILLLHGVRNKNIFMTGMDFQKPIASNGTEEGRRKNRRVEFELRKK